MPGKAAEDGTITHVEDQDEDLGSSFGLAIVATCGLNQWMEAVSVSPFLSGILPFQ